MKAVAKVASKVHWALTVIREDVTLLALIDDVALGHGLCPALVRVAQVLCGQLGDGGLEEVCGYTGLWQRWCALCFVNKQEGE